MDQTLKEAAETGNVSKLYELLERDGNVLRRIDEVEFIDTPLHTAAEKGRIGFAMEIMSLKPSFARKLNHQGLSALHLAVKNRQVKMALRLVEIDKDLVRVRGKNGETPLHYLSKVENRDGLLDRFVEACPESIRDLTSQNRTALHIAIENNKPDVLQVLIRSLRKKDYYQEVVNRQDEDGNTALHIAAGNNQTKMLGLLLKCKADKHVKNDNKKTALDEAHDTQSILILRGCFRPEISNSMYELKKKIVKYVTMVSSLIFHDMDNISGDDRNALLVVLGLLPTVTYQATLSPPGGLRQSDSTSKDSYYYRAGQAVMDEISFIYFYVPNYVAFMVSFFLTLALLKPYPKGFRVALQVLLAFLVICFDQSVSFIAPDNGVLLDQVLNLLSGIIFIFMMFMCIANEVSKLSVSIVACWMLPLDDYLGGTAQHLVLGMLLFMFLYDDFWKGTILLIGYSSYSNLNILLNRGERHWEFFVAIIGCWLFLHLCRFCIKQCPRLRIHL